jgi:hypothetical protein
VDGFCGQGELAVHPERVAVDAFDDPRRRPACQSELEAAAEGVAEEAHLLDADVVERELQAVERVLERPPPGQGEQVGDDDACPIGEQARHRQIRGRLHAVAVEQHDRRPGADIEMVEGARPAVVRHAATVSTGRRRGPISKNVATFSNS